MISPDVKADVKQKIKELVTFYKKYLFTRKLEIQCKTDMYLLFNFAWYSIQLNIVCYEQWSGRVLLNGQNLFSMLRNPYNIA